MPDRFLTIELVIMHVMTYTMKELKYILESMIVPQRSNASVFISKTYAFGNCANVRQLHLC